MTGDPSRNTAANREAPVAIAESDERTWGVNPWVLALVATHVALGILAFEPVLFTGADAGHYMVLGEALRGGLGFRDIHLPGSPLHAKFPPGYPLLLAGAGWLGGLQLFKILSLVCTSAAVWLCFRIGEPVLGKVGGLVAAGVLAVSPVLLDFSHRVLSEAPFTMLLLLAVLSGGGSGRWWIGGVAAAAAAFFTRTAGLAILIALITWYFAERERRRAAIVVAVGAACVIGWAAYQKVANPAHPGYLEQLVLLNPYDPAAGTTGLLDFPIRVARNSWRYVSAEFPGSLGLPTLRRATVARTAAAGVLISGLGVGGWVVTALRRVTLAHLVSACYVGLILLWPPIWTDRRFLLPVLPLLLIWATAGVLACEARIGRRATLAAGAFLAAALAGTSVLSTVRVIPARLACQVSFRSGAPCDPVQYAEFYEMARWVGANTPETAVVANRSPATFYLLSGRQGDVYRYSRDADVVLAGLEEMGADFVVVDRLSTTTRLYLVPAIGAHIDRFELVHVAGEEEGTLLLRLLGTPRTALVSAEP